MNVKRKNVTQAKINYRHQQSAQTPQMEGRPSEGTVWTLESPEVLLQSDKCQSHHHLGSRHYQRLVTHYYFPQPGADKGPAVHRHGGCMSGKTCCPVLVPLCTATNRSAVTRAAPKGLHRSSALHGCPLRGQIIIIEDELVWVCNPLEPSSSRPSSR